jgi:molybdopterin synthase sulfur carrier subunit
MRIRYFAWLREKIGTAEETLELPPQVQTIGALIAWLQTRDAGHAAAFADPKLIRCAVDLEFATTDTPILGAAEIAFFPPVTGG